MAEVRDIDKALAMLIKEMDSGANIKHIYQGSTLLDEGEVADMVEEQIRVARDMLNKRDRNHQRTRLQLQEAIEHSEAELNIYRRGK